MSGIGRGLRMDVALEKLIDEYRRCKAAGPLNLSGKRTEDAITDICVSVHVLHSKNAVKFMNSSSGQLISAVPFFIGRRKEKYAGKYGSSALPTCGRL